MFDMSLFEFVQINQIKSDYRMEYERNEKISDDWVEY